MLKRRMAGEYSCELSIKVFTGQRRLIELGYRLGGDEVTLMCFTAALARNGNDCLFVHSTCRASCPKMGLLGQGAHFPEGE